ncbi:MFS transporter [Streptosporangiaceae bacterium NEAU-GS5]|nr:MFS transporter [Streptosporangiaceae bacterium NEAU-GS5]
MIPSKRLWAALVVLCAALFLDALDVSMVAIALPSIQADLGMATSSLQWVVSGYVLGYGGLLLLGGRAADLLGRRKVFLAALAVFAVASLLGGLMSNGSLLIAARFIKGVSAAFTAPASLSIITTTFEEGPARNRALSIYTACGASGFSLGLVLSGLLTEIGWRWTFLMPVPIAIAALIAGWRLLPRTQHVPEGGGYDIAGAVTITGAMLLLVFGVVQAPQASGLRTVLTLAAAAALLAAFIVVELRTRHPLVRLGILRSGPLVRANLGAVALFGSYVGLQFVLMQYFQNMLGWSPLQTALIFFPAGLLVALSATRISRVVDRYGTARLITIGSASLLGGYLLWLGLGPQANLWLYLPAMLLLGGGFALSFPSLNIQATQGVRDDEQGLASGLVNTAFQVGGAVMLAISTAVVTSGGGPLTIGSVRSAVIVSVVTALIALGVAVTGLVLKSRRADVPVGQEVLETV